MGAGLGLLMVAIALCDVRHFVFPDVLPAAGLGLGLANAGLRDWATGVEGVGAALLRGAAVAFCFFVIRAAYHRLRSRHGLGLGDVKLAGVAGAWLGWATIPIAIE